MNLVQAESITNEISIHTDCFDKSGREMASAARDAKADETRTCHDTCQDKVPILSLGVLRHYG